MFPRTIHGWFTEILSWRGRDGTSIPEFGMAAHTSRSEPALALASSAVLDGAGLTGDSIGITGTQLLTTAGTTPGAIHFITGAASTGGVPGEAESTVATGVEFAPAPTQGTDLSAGTSVGMAELTTAPAQRLGLSMEIARLREDTLNHAVRAACARAPSAATTMAARPEAFRHEEAPASVAEADVAVVGVGAVEGGGSRKVRYLPGCL